MINNALFNQNIIFRDPANGRIKEIPISSLVQQEKKNSFNAIKHRELNRVVTLYSSVLAGYNANEVVDQVKKALRQLQLPEEIKFKFSGEIEEQEKNMAFLSKALASCIRINFVAPRFPI